MLPVPSDDEAASKRRRRHVGSLFSYFRRLYVMVILVLLVVILCWHTSFDAIDEHVEHIHFDAVIIPGGGLTDGKPAAWVAARLDVALKYDSQTDYYLVLSRGTTHKPPPLDSTGFPIDESFASAAYLLDKGVEQRRVLLESWSLDTIGNAAFARLMHADLRGWRRILVVTSASHMPRTRAIFEWVFSLPPGGAGARGGRPRPMLEFVEVSDADMLDAEQLESRRQKEAASVKTLREKTMVEIGDLAALHAFLFERHGAYRAMSVEDQALRVHERAQGGLARTY